MLTQIALRDGNRMCPDKRPSSREEFWIHAKSTRLKSRFAAVCSLRGQGNSWHRTWVQRLWDQRSQSNDLL